MANLKNTVISDAQFRLPVGDTAARPGSPNSRQIRFNTETGKLEQFRPGVGDWIAPSNSGVIATGGDSVYDVDVEGTTYRVHVFTATGTSTFSVLQGGEVEYLIVAGGGGGGYGGPEAGGGGGAGGLISGFTNVENQTYSLLIGEGGAGSSTSAGVNGSDTSAFNLTALGGGGGARYNQDGIDGGSGGGASDAPGVTGGTATQPEIGGQGNNGGNADSHGHAGAGGGGAGGKGEDATGNGSAGSGGIGVPVPITGVYTFFAGGGGGGGRESSAAEIPGNGGLGGGGKGGDPTTSEQPREGLRNTGAGGGGGRSNSGGAAGGSGIVVIRYPLRQENPVTAPGRDVQDGLVLDLDFAKPTVYAGSGNVVTDGRLNGIEGDIIGSPVFANPRTHRSAFELLDNDYIGTNLTNDFFTNADGEGSILFWFRPLKESGEQTQNDIVMSVDNPSSNRSWDFRWGESTNRIEFRTFGSLGINLSKTVNPREWYLISLTYKENDTARLYINSQEQDSGSIGTFDNLDTTFFINAREGGGTGTAQEMGILRIYNKNLSSDEISQYYNATRWRFGV